ncbi:protein kinase [Oligoflexaceae bacterium]|nr:protein kinase [Oligoflexaceae bacterium]
MQGKLIGERYRVLDRLGEGGMAVVYIARDEKLDRKVAIKVLHQHFSDNDDIRARFAMEATAISKMDHPNILKVYDFSGPNSDQLWIVTEVLYGQNLSQFAKSFRNSCVNPIVSCFVVREILKALDHAHGVDIVHRDIKPENVMVLKNGRIILMDFGIAKNMHKTSKTMTGTFMGSPSYMSPEQVRGKDIDVRTDIYSLGILFYEIISGHLPFTGDSTHAVILKIMEGRFTEPKYLIPGLPEEINHIVCHAFKKRPIDRFQNSNSFAEQIDMFIQKIGFVESHVELERYAMSPSKYMERLVKMTQQSLKVGTERTQLIGADIAARNQTSILEPVANDMTRYQRTPIRSTRKDRTIPQKVRIKAKTEIDRSVIARKTQLLGRTGMAQQPKPLKRRVRPAVPKRSRPAPLNIGRQRRVIRTESPLLGMLIVAAMVSLLFWGFNELVIKTFDPAPIEAPRKPSFQQPKKTLKKTTPKLRTPRKATPEKTPKRRIKKQPRKTYKPKRTPKAEPKTRYQAVTPAAELPTPPTTAEAAAIPEKKIEDVQPEPKVEKPVTLKLAKLTISANTAARITINGRPYGTTVDDTYHSREIELKPGNYNIILKHRSYEDLVINRRLKSGERLRLHRLKMTKKVAKIPLTIRIDKFPTKMTIRGKDSSVFIRRDIYGAGESIVLEPGAYALRLDHQGQVIEREISLKENSGGITINLNFSRLK